MIKLINHTVNTGTLPTGSFNSCDQSVLDACAKMYPLFKKEISCLQRKLQKQENIQTRIPKSINNLAVRSYRTAIIRGKVTTESSVKDWKKSISEEVAEFMKSSNKESEHLEGYSDVEEEAADVIISLLSFLKAKDVNIEKLLLTKINYNEIR